jgi:hypothetical protein
VAFGRWPSVAQVMADDRLADRELAGYLPAGQALVVQLPDELAGDRRAVGEASPGASRYHCGCLPGCRNLPPGPAMR